MSPAEQRAIDQAQAVLIEHFAALNDQNAARLHATLHFPHYRLARSRLQTWSEPSHYLADFHARTTDDWHHSVLDQQEVVAATADKVHLNVTFTRYRQDGTAIGVYRSLWVIAHLDGRWAAQLRSSFAD